MAIGMPSVEEPITRFKQLMIRSVKVARTRIEGADPQGVRAEEARTRALNVLSYALKEAEAWTETRDLLLAMAPKMEMVSQRAGWLEYLQEGIAQSQRQGDRLAEAALQFQCGYLYRLISRYTQAQTLLQASATHYATIGDTQSQARALNQLAYLAWQQHRYDHAVTLAEEALVLLDHLDLERATALSALGLVAIDRGQWQEAQQYHSEALSIRTHHAQRRQMAWSLQNLAFTMRGQQQYEKAILYYEEAIAMLDEVHDPLNRATAQMNLGIVYYFQEEYAKAQEINRRAEATFRRLADEFNLGKVRTNQGLVYLARQEWHKAEEAFIESSNCFQKLADRSWYLNAFDGLGIAFLEQGFYDKALVIFESVQAQLSDIVDTPAYHYLTSTIAVQLEQARSRVVKRGLSTWKPPKSND